MVQKIRVKGAQPKRPTPKNETRRLSECDQSRRGCVTRSKAQRAIARAEQVDDMLDGQGAR